MKNATLKKISLAVSLTWAIAPIATVYAADEKAPVLETITVTAERSSGFKTNYVQVGAFRDANILDVPLTISVMPRALLDAQDAQGLYDALKNSAGVTRAQTSGTVADNLQIRGINIDNRTSYRLNGSLPLNNLIDLPLENKERVEALKGSSALYYGFTSPAGVVNLVTKRARDEANASVSLSANRYGQQVVGVDAGSKFGEQKQFGARVNIVNGKLGNAIKDFTGTRSLYSIALDWRATKDLSFKVDFEKLHKNAVEQASVGLLAAVNGVVTLPSIPDATKLLTGTWAVWRGRAENKMIRADYSISDNWALSAEVGRAETFRDTRASTSVINYNLGTGAGTLRSVLVRGQVYKNDNTRIELSGRVVWGFLDQEFTLGYMQNKRFQNGPTQQTFNTPQNLFSPINIAEPVYTLNAILNPQNVTDKGLYVLDRIRLNEQWQVLIGERKTDYTNQSVAATATTSVTSVYAVKKTSPSVGVIYKPWNHTSIYATYIEGLEEGGTAPVSAVNAFQVLNPGVSKQKELGIRSEALPGVSATLAYFNIDRPSAILNAANVFALDGRSEYKGFEYSLTGEVTPELSVYVSGLFLDAKLKSAANTALIGKTPENTPKQSHSVFAEYRPAAFKGFSVNAGAFLTADRPVDNLNQAYISGYTIFTLGGKYLANIDGHKYSFQLNLDNATDKRYWNAAGGSLLAVGLPRTLKAVLKAEF